MGDLTKILAGNVDEVKTALADKSHVDLHALRKEEEAGKNRAGVLSAIDAALAALANNGSEGGVEHAALERADIPAAETIDTSGAPQQIVPDVDLDHPAVDNDPRAGTSADQNRIDFNDPSLDGREVVEKSLNDQAKA
jgi:hypothetical protein